MRRASLETIAGGQSCIGASGIKRFAQWQQGQGAGGGSGADEDADEPDSPLRGILGGGGFCTFPCLRRRRAPLKPVGAGAVEMCENRAGSLGCPGFAALTVEPGPGVGEGCDPFYAGAAFKGSLYKKLICFKRFQPFCASVLERFRVTGNNVPAFADLGRNSNDAIFEIRLI